jgi:hypothetical protein
MGDSYPDIEKEYEMLDIKKYNVDIAFINRSFASENGAKFIEKYIAPKNTVLMHFANNGFYRSKPFAEEYKNKLSPILIFEKPMETIVFD